MVSMSITEVMLMLQDMIAAVADCFSALKSSRKKPPDCVSYKYGDLPILWSFNLEALQMRLIDLEEKEHYKSSRRRFINETERKVVAKCMIKPGFVSV